MNDMKVEGIFKFEQKDKLKLPMYTEGVSAGFPSPADDFVGSRLDLNELLVKHPQATFFVKVSGNSMINAGIHSGDILIVDRACEPVDGKIVIAIIDGDFTVKRLKVIRGIPCLVPENPDYPIIEMKDSMELMIWGVVTSVIHIV
jgi:DNA polymerase V